MEDIELEALRQEFLTLYDHGRILDRFYIPTRYPNGLPELIPSEAYGLKDADEGILLTKEIIEHVHGAIKF
jgi:HEPN domain-containing protein